jgi:hypothetical protein
MKVVPKAQLEPGHVLAQDIRRRDGMLVLKAGTPLTPGMIVSLDRLVEVETVAVEGSPFASPEEAQAWRDAELRALLHRFSKSTDDPFMDKLKKLEAKRIVETAKV